MNSSRNVACYLAGLVVVILVTVLRFLLDPILEDQYPYLLSFLAVILNVSIGNSGSSLFVAITAGFIAFWCFALPGYSLSDASPSDIIGLVGYYLAAICMVWMGHSLRKAKEQAQKLADEAVRSEEALRESEEKFRVMTENSRAAFGIVQGTRFIYANPAFAQMTGYSIDEILQMDFPQLVHPDFVNLMTERAQRRQAGEVVVEHYEFQMMTKSGLPRWVDFSPSRIEFKGKPAIIGTGFDVTERKLAEEALRLQEQRLDIAQRAGRIGTYDRLLQENRTVWSRQTEELYGLQPGSFGGRDEDWEKMIHPDDHDRVMELSARGIREERDICTEFRIVWPDGSIHWILDMGHPIFDKNGAPVRLVGVNMDITERKCAEEALREADRKKDEFLAVLAHELRNPMAAISAAETLLSRPAVDAGKLLFARNALRERIKQLSRLIDDLLDVTRITRGKIELHRENLEIESVIDRAVEATKAFFIDRRQQITVRVATPLPVFGDPVRLEQVITNLLTNASRYSEEGQEIGLTAFREEASAVIRVRDHGVGISPSLLARIFQPFVQAESSLARARGGLGLGLTIAKNLCELHGGCISVSSDGEGKGSEFEVRIPVGEGHIRTATKEGAMPVHAPLRILLVEDNTDTALMGAAMLQLDGNTVEIAGDGPAGVDRALSMNPDVILLDIGLPGFTGYEVAKRLRKAGLGCLIIAVTGYGQEQDIARAYEAGIDHHLLKPMDYKELAGLLAKKHIGAAGLRAH